MPLHERGDKVAIETGDLLMPKFDQDGLIPAVATDSKTGEVLMLAYMNAESLQKTLAIGEAVYFSRSRQEIWHKGATSGQIQRVIELRVDCDQDAIWLKVEQLGGGACHTGKPTCFYRRAIPGDSGKLISD
ncbi:phosphoribosyl-AMP cyclohydrolase [Kamptonema cortianum]|nr:phosphoribosyl-AMP cyclohydrolase [Geitlerinema splendidum]MDK3158759.1 phosphoribosyl-AMP cyclohydrolase [Kamptonema cortianum]